MTTQGVTTPTVIVATEYESVVRLYVGHPSNGGMHQTGQFTATRAIDPNDLAGMAVDLAASFGWLGTTDAVEAEPAPAALPAAPVKEHTNGARVGVKNPTDRLPCPLDSAHIISRQNMFRHLRTQQHGLSFTQATALVQALPATPVEATEPVKASAPLKASAMMPRGKAGSEHLRNVIFPRITKIMAGYSNPVSSVTLAKRLNCTQQQAARWLHKLAARGDIVATNTDGRRISDPLTYVLATRIVETAPPAMSVHAPTHAPMGDTQSFDSPHASDYDAGSTQSVHERNEPV